MSRNGQLDPDRLPPEMVRVSQLLDAARGTALADDLDRRTVTSMVEVIRAAGPDALAAPRHRRKSVFAKALTAKTAIAAGVVLFTATGAAAATENLPDAAQEALADVADDLGVPGVDHPDNPGKAKGHDKDGDGEETTLGGTASHDENDNHGADVSAEASDKSDETGDENHGEVVREVARANSGQTTGADARDANGADADDEEHGAPVDPGAERGRSGDHLPDDED